MRINRVAIDNFRAIRTLSIDDLRDLIVLAGPNGSGKSAVLDALRLLKSSYGGYEQEEWRSWFGEFQIDLNLRRQSDLRRLFRDPTRPVRIEAWV